MLPFRGSEDISLINPATMEGTVDRPETIQGPGPCQFLLMRLHIEKVGPLYVTDSLQSARRSALPRGEAAQGKGWGGCEVQYRRALDVNAPFENP